MAYDNNMMETKTQRLDFNYSNENCFKCLMKKIEELMKLLKSLRMCNDNVSDLFTATLIEKLLLALNIGNPKSQSSVSIFFSQYITVFNIENHVNFR